MIDKPKRALLELECVGATLQLFEHSLVLRPHWWLSWLRGVKELKYADIEDVRLIDATYHHHELQLTMYDDKKKPYVLLYPRKYTNHAREVYYFINQRIGSHDILPVFNEQPV